MSSPSQQRSPFIRWLDTFLQEENIKWILGLGVCILLGSSLRLVTLHWADYTPAWKNLVLLGYTIAIHGLGQFGYHRLGLRKTGTVLMSLTVLLIPINFLSLHWIQPRADSLFTDGVWNASLSILIGLNLIGSALAANRIFVHFLRKPHFTFLVCYLILCLSGAIVPGLPRSWSPAVALSLWAVFTIGTVKVNRHVFWLMEEHRLPRIFGFFPILLLGAQFSAVFSLSVARHLTLPWLGLLCTLVSLPILLSANAVARVFEQRTGGLIRPIPWSISGPLTFGTLLNIAGVIMAITGWPAQTEIVPTAIIAAISLGVVARRTQKIAFAWGSVVMILVAYQTCPALVKELVLQLRDHAAAAVNESRLPYAFYGLTYAPLITTFALAGARLQRNGNRLFGIPLQATATGLSLVTFGVSFTHPSAIFPVALILCPLFVAQMMLFRQRMDLIPAAMCVMAAAYGFPGFAERVLLWSIAPEYQLLLWTVASGLLMAPGAFIDRWSLRFRGPAASEKSSHGIDDVCQLISLASVIVSAGIWQTMSALPFGTNLMALNAVIIGLLLAAHALRWLKPGIGDLTLLFGTSAIHWYLANCQGWILSAFDTICAVLLVQWILSYILDRYKSARISRAFGAAMSRISAVGLAIPFCAQIVMWVSVHCGAHPGNWTMSLILMAWALDAARRISNWHLTTFVWWTFFVLVSACTADIIGRHDILTWVMLVWTVTGLVLVGFRRAILAIVIQPSPSGVQTGASEISSGRRTIIAWIEPLESLLPVLFATIAAVSLVFLGWPKQIAGLLAIGGLLVMDRSKIQAATLTLAGPLLNWQILVATVGVFTGVQGAVMSLTAEDLSVVALPLAALASISCLVFEWRTLRNWINCPELVAVHQISLVALTAMLLSAPHCLSSLFAWTETDILWTVLTFAALTASAASSAVRRRSSDQAWLAEFTLAGSVMYFVALGRIGWDGQEMMYGALLAGLIHVGLAKWTGRSVSLSVLSEPMRLTGFWLPTMVVPLALCREIMSSSIDWTGSNSLPLLGSATFYFWRGLERRSLGILSISAIILNVGFALLWKNLGWSDPQLFMIPIGISILAVTELLRSEIPGDHHQRLRLIGSLMILVSPVFHIVTGSWVHILTLMIASAALAIFAIGMRIRSLLYTSTAFLLADLVALIARSSADEPNILWIAGVVLGAGILTMGAICENHREQLLARLRGLAAELEQWS